MIYLQYFLLIIICFLCLVTYVGFVFVFYQMIKETDWGDEDDFVKIDDHEGSK